MQAFQVLDFFSFFLVVGSFVVLYLGQRGAVSKDERLLLFGLLFVTFFHVVSDILEWSFNVGWIDNFADYTRILQPVFFGFFLFSHIRSVEISKLKDAEKEVRELSRFRERIIQDAAIWLSVLDKKANVLVWNKAAEEISGYSEGDVLGHDKIWEWLYPDESYRRGVMRKVADILKGKKMESYETVIRCKDDEKKVISWTSHPLKNENGEITGSIALGRDITEQKEAEERKDFLNTLLRQDVRSKCQTVQGYLQLLEHSDLTEEQRKYMTKSVGTGREAQEILGLAERLEEIEKSDWIAEKDVLKVLEHVIRDISDLFDRVRVELEKNYHEGVGRVEGDYSLEILFSQILKTRIQTSDSDKIRVSVEEEKEKVLVSIEDNGEKLSEDIKILFTGEAYTGSTSGSGGVRYYMIKQISEHNNIEIEAKDSELGGARFDVYLRKALK